MSQPSPTDTEPLQPAAIRMRALRPWRWGFGLYLLLLATLTHWPHLQMDSVGARPRDKIMHWLCFGGLAILLWRTRWITRAWQIVVAVMAYAVFDEITQGLFTPGRPFSWTDLAANLLGVLSAGFVILAMRPVGGATNRLRVERFEYIIDTLLSRPRAWLLLVPQTLGLAVLVGGVVWYSTRWYHGVADYGASFVAVAVGAIAGSLGAIAWLYRKELARFSEQQSCSRCGASCAAAPTGTDGSGTCPQCGAPFHVGQWTVTADLPRSVLSQTALRAAVPSLVLGVIVLLAFATMVYLYGRWPEFRRLAATSIRQMDLVGSAIDMALFTALASLMLYRFRIGLARLFDQQAERCRACRHDVHATPTSGGLGRCPECGAEFMRLSQPSV